METETSRQRIGRAADVHRALTQIQHAFQLAAQPVHRRLIGKQERRSGPALHKAA